MLKYIFYLLFLLSVTVSIQSCKLHKQQIETSDEEKANREGFNARQANDMVNYREGHKEKDMKRSDNAIFKCERVTFKSPFFYAYRPSFLIALLIKGEYFKFQNFRNKSTLYS